MTHSVPRGDPSGMLGALIEESRQLREDVAQRETRHREEVRRNERRQRSLIIFVAVGIVVAILLITSVVVLLVQSRQRGSDTRTLLRANSVINERIADCTTVGGRCYEENLRRSGLTVQQLMLAEKAIAVCQRRTDTVTGLSTCVDAEIERIYGNFGATPRPTGGPTPRPTPDPVPSTPTGE